MRDKQARPVESGARASNGSTPPALTLFLANLDSEEAEEFTGKCIYFIRLAKSDVRYDHLIDDVVSGSLEHPFLESMDLLLSEMFSPLLRNASELEKLSKEE
jgi:hypothetical protein